tara:strand:+ start:525 stop:1100 length:576 start_codon:yes stop_codon:yes gene_type:complete
MKTVILLIDFDGHKILADEYVNKLRYSTLQHIIDDTEIDRNANIILSIGNSVRDEKLKELKSMAIEDKWQWLEIPDDSLSVESIEKLVLEKLNFSMNNTDTQIVIGGCNTAGCVIKSKLCSAKYFSWKQYKTIILLPMCAEYAHHGINDVEKNMRAFGKVFTFIKDNKLKNIHIAEDVMRVNFIKYDKQII